MIETAKALYTFLSGFGIPAYGTNTVPDEAELPYLTYPLTEPYWNVPTSFYITVYYRNKDSNFASLAKADEIVKAVGEVAVIACKGGYIVLRPDTLPIQELPPEGDVRGAYISFQLNAFKTNDDPQDDEEPGAQTPAENEEREDE